LELKLEVLLIRILLVSVSYHSFFWVNIDINVYVYLYTHVYIYECQCFGAVVSLAISLSPPFPLLSCINFSKESQVEISWHLFVTRFLHSTSLELIYKNQNVMSVSYSTSNIFIYIHIHTQTQKYTTHTHNHTHTPPTCLQRHTSNDTSPETCHVPNEGTRALIPLLTLKTTERERQTDIHRARVCERERE